MDKPLIFVSYTKAFQVRLVWLKITLLPVLSFFTHWRLQCICMDPSWYAAGKITGLSSGPLAPANLANFSWRGFWSSASKNELMMVCAREVLNCGKGHNYLHNCLWNGLLPIVVDRRLLDLFWISSAWNKAMSANPDRKRSREHSLFSWY